MKSGIKGIATPKIIKLNPKQCAFIYSKARFKAYFGGICSGKTTAACLHGLDMSLKNPGCISMIVRNTSPELEISIKKMFLDLVRQADAGRTYGRSIVDSINHKENWCRFTNGSVVFFKHTQDEGLFRGPELGWFILDQAEDIDESIAELLIERLRQPNMPQVGMFIGNTDKGHNWCYRWFKKGELPDSELIETTIFDNLVFFEETNNYGYLNSLMNRPEEWKKVKLYGSWDTLGGQIIRLENYHILKPFAVPKSWYRFITVDPAGSTGTTAALAVARDSWGNWVVYKEYYASNRIIKEHAEGILSLWGDEPVHTIYFDPSAWRKESGSDGTSFTTLVDRYREYGVFPIPAEHSISVGIDMIVEKLQPSEGHKHIVTGRAPAPYLYFVKDNLPNTFEEIATWSYEDPEKEPVHAMDCLRYALASSLPYPVIESKSYEEQENYTFMGV